MSAESGVNSPHRPPLLLLHGQSNPTSDTTLAPATHSSQHPQQKSESASDSSHVFPETGTTAPKKSFVNGYRAPMFYAFGIGVAAILLFAPWIFFIVVSHAETLTLPTAGANLVANHPRKTTQIVVSFSGVVASLVAYVFGAALTSVVQKRVTRPSSDLKIKHFGRFAKIARFGLIFELNTWAGIALLFFVANNQISAGLSAMFTPQSVSLTANLTGQEIDLSSTNSECIDWYTNPSSALSSSQLESCDYASRGGFVFSTCLSENQLPDVIKAGRDTAMFQNTSLPITFSSLNSTRYFGSFPGVLLAGPNGLNILSPVTPNDSFVGSPNGEQSYNYTLSLQGVSIDVDCSYQDSGPIGAAQVDLTSDTNSTADTPSSAISILWTPSCPSGTSDSFINLTDYTYLATSVDSLNVAMGSWACKENSTDSSLNYSIYFRTTGNYKPILGNMTCTVGAALANYMVEYVGDAQYFRTSEGPTTPDQSSDSPSVFANVFDEVVQHNVLTTIDSQTTAGNQVAGTVVAIASEYYGLADQSGPNDAYPTIMASVLQGMLNYQAGYLRLIYTGENADFPDSCFRNITGSVTYHGIGWSIHGDQFGPYFLAAYTILLLLSLAFYVIGLFMHERYDQWDPTNPTDVCAAGVIKKIHASGEPADYEAAKEAHVNREM